MFKQKFIKFNVVLLLAFVTFLFGCAQEPALETNNATEAALDINKATEDDQAIYTLTICYHYSNYKDAEIIKKEFTFTGSNSSKKVTLTNPFTNDRNYFGGWTTDKYRAGFLSSDYIEYYDNQEVAFDFSDKTTLTVDLYSFWFPISSFAKIIFNANDGSELPATKTIFVEKDKTIYLKETSFTKEGYWIKGWSTNKDASTYEYENHANFKVTENVTLYALWFELSKVTIYYHAEDENIQDIKEVVDLPEPDNNGYYNFSLNVNEPFGRIKGKYVKYFKDENKKEIVANKFSVTEWHLKNTYLNEIHVYAEWETGNEYIQITLYKNDGTDSIVHTQEFKRLGNSYFDCSSYTPERDGFYFLGWSANPDDKISDVTEKFDLDEIDPMDYDVKYYAIWSDKTKVIYLLKQFYENNSDYIVIQDYDEYFTIPDLPSIVRNGNAFIGWRTVENVYYYVDYIYPGSILKWNNDYLANNKNIVKLTFDIEKVEKAVKLTFHNNIPDAEEETFVQYYKIRTQNGRPKTFMYIPENRWSRDGYYLSGWDQDPASEWGADQMSFDSNNLPKEGDEYDLYAIWRKKTSE